MIPHLFTVVLAGGSGTRFWPASRAARPKQLLAIGPSELSLIASTVRRVEPLCDAEHTLIATGERLLEATRAALPWLPPESFMGEPVARNTAPCIAWATWEAARRDPDAVVMVLPSDHHVADEPAYRAALERAVAVARGGAIVTIGVEPTRPETGYGYIEAGDAIQDDVYRVARFVEKPDRARAEADVMLAAVRAHLPEVAAALDALAESPPDELLERTRTAFERFPSISIDYAVMEKAEDLAVVVASFGWNDLGSWQSAWELGAKDEHGNVAPPDAILADARGNLVRDLRTDRSGKLTALVGVEGLCVIQTDDALLVIPRELAQDVRKVVDELKKRSQSQLL